MYINEDVTGLMWQKTTTTTILTVLADELCCFVFDNQSKNTLCN